jgi:hypothetical protein
MLAKHPLIAARRIKFMPVNGPPFSLLFKPFVLCEQRKQLTAFK